MNNSNIPEWFQKSSTPLSLARYPGGKGHNAKKINQYIPNGNIYLEPYCGMASLFAMQTKFAAYALNDIDQHIITLMRVLQNEQQYQELMRRLIYTPYSVDEFAKAIEIYTSKTEDNPIIKSWAFLVKQIQGFSGISKTKGNWGRSLQANNNGMILYNYWQKKIANLNWWHEKLMGVYLDNKDALEFIPYWDATDNVFYIDPPYIKSTRLTTTRDIYHNESDDEHHKELVNILTSLKGKAVLSCYDSPIYDLLLEHGWKKQHFSSAVSMASKARGTKYHGGKESSPRSMETIYIKE